MGLLEDMKADEIKKGPPCSLEVVLREMKNPDREDLLEAMKDPTIMATTISRVLARRGVKVGPQAIRRHRNGECRCE